MQVSGLAWRLQSEAPCRLHIAADAYEHLRRYPLNVVLAALGFEDFRYRKAGTEGYGSCPIHGSKKNTTCFSFNDDGRFNFAFSFFQRKAGGAIDLVMQIRKVGFKTRGLWLKDSCTLTGP